MGLKIWLINGILAVVAAFFGIRAFDVWGDGGKSLPEIHAVDRSDAKPRTMTPKGIIARPVLPESAYQAVVSNNLFSPTRKPSEAEDGATADGEEWSDSPEGKNLLSVLKEMTLYGVVITDDSKAALVTTPDTSASTPATSSKGKMADDSGRSMLRSALAARVIPRGVKAPGLAVAQKKKTEWVRVGDSLNAFTVTDIMPDRVLLKADSKEFDLLMHDKEKPKSHAPVTTAADKKVAEQKETADGKNAEKVTSEKKASQEEAESLKNRILNRSQHIEAVRGRMLPGAQTTTDTSVKLPLPGER
jgi:hypothetical protein